MPEPIKILEKKDQNQISKKIAAREIYQLRKMSKINSITGIVCVLLSVMLYTANTMLGSIIIMGYVGYMGFVTVKDTKEIKRLEETYKLQND